MAFRVDYLGGIPKLRRAGEAKVRVSSTAITVWKSLLRRAKIQHSTITEVALKTDEQLSKDITLSRLIALGVSAQDTRNTKKHVTKNLIISYDYKGIGSTAVFSGDAVPRIHSAVLRKVARYRKRNPDIPEPSLAQDFSQQQTSQTISAADELAKFKELLDNGTITKKEFDAKKKQLLNQ